MSDKGNQAFSRRGGFIDKLASDAAAKIEGDKFLHLMGETVSLRTAELVNGVLADYPDLTTMTTDEADSHLYQTFHLVIDGAPRQIIAKAVGTAAARDGCFRCGTLKNEERAFNTMYCTGGGCFCVRCMFTKFSRLVRDDGNSEKEWIPRLVDWLHGRLDPVTLSELRAAAAADAREISDREVVKPFEERDAAAAATAEALWEFLAACERNGPAETTADHSQDGLVN